MSTTIKKIILLLIGINMLYSCKTKEKSEVPATEKSSQLEEVKVIFFEVAGCGYMLQRQNKTRLQPVNLSEQYHKEGLTLLVTYKIIHDAVTICMAGDVVELKTIKIKD
jgi:hypothetical protein